MRKGIAARSADGAVGSSWLNLSRRLWLVVCDAVLTNAAVLAARRPAVGS